MIVDSHCHLDFSNLYEELDNVLARAEKNNIKKLLTISTTLDSFNKILKIVKKYKNVYGTFGIHPHETKNFREVNIDYILTSIKNNKKIIGVGESGLDFYYNHSDKKIQIQSFVNHIIASSKLNIPIIVHSRSAELETYEILKTEKKNLNLKVLIHCFTGSKDFAKKLLDIGCYISLSGIVTFKKSTDLQKTAEYIPIDRLLIETDSPYLTPAPLRGKSNEPSFIIHTLNKLAEIKKLKSNDIEKNTTLNFLKLFDIKS